MPHDQKDISPLLALYRQMNLLSTSTYIQTKNVLNIMEGQIVWDNMTALFCPQTLLMIPICCTWKLLLTSKGIEDFSVIACDHWKWDEVAVMTAILYVLMRPSTRDIHGRYINIYILSVYISIFRIFSVLTLYNYTINLLVCKLWYEMMQYNRKWNLHYVKESKHRLFYTYSRQLWHTTHVYFMCL